LSWAGFLGPEIATGGPPSQTVVSASAWLIHIR
jgi:hypothetical protein